MEITLIKTLNGSLKPAHNSDYDNLKKIPLNEPLVFSWSKPRNYEFHKKFFGLLKLAFDNQELFDIMDDMREELIIEAGFFRLTYDINGVEKKKAKSISFALMDEVEFNELYSCLINVIVKWLGITKEDIIEHIEQYF